MKQGKKKRATGDGGAKHRMEGVPVAMGSLFIDSGAHSLYNREVDGKGPKRNDAASMAHKYGFFDLKKGSDFRKFLEDYVAFLRENGSCIDHYVTLDAIYNPEKTWEITTFLEDEYGLKPVPVIHCHADLKWFVRYIERGHKLIGIGGLGQGITKSAFLSWGDKVFRFLGSLTDGAPVVKTHGFAMTSWELLLRYPWWSVDSASWLKAAAFGQVYVPHKRNGKFVFTEAPYPLSTSPESPNRKVKGKHIDNLTRSVREIVGEWFDQIGITFEEREGMTQSDKLAVRAKANLLYFEALRAELRFPRTFETRPERPTFGLVSDSSTLALPKRLAKTKHEDEPLRIYYSGLSGGGVFPEVLIHDLCPHVMLSFDNLRTKTDGATAWRRFNVKAQPNEKS